MLFKYTFSDRIEIIFSRFYVEDRIIRPLRGRVLLFIFFYKYRTHPGSCCRLLKNHHFGFKKFRVYINPEGITYL